MPRWCSLVVLYCTVATLIISVLLIVRQAQVIDTVRGNADRLKQLEARP